MAGDKSVNIFHSHMIRFESIRLFVWILVLRFGACDGLESFAGDRFTADAHAQICASILTNIQTRYFNHPLNLPGGKSYGWIRTNTAAFQQYALETSVTRLVDVLNAWRFPVNPMVKCDDISRFEVNPSYFGLNCFLQLQKRYGLLIDRNQISNFSDDDFSLSSFEHRQERLEKVLNKTNLLTTKSAEQVARNALRALGLENGQNTQLREPPHVVQLRTDSGLMPYFYVEWKDPDYKGRNDTQGGTSVFFEICGVSSNVSHFFLIQNPGNRQALRLPEPANFFQLLGLSGTNRMWRTEWMTESGK